MSVLDSQSGWGDTCWLRYISLAYTSLTTLVVFKGLKPTGDDDQHPRTGTDDDGEREQVTGAECIGGSEIKDTEKSD